MLKLVAKQRIAYRSLRCGSRSMQMASASNGSPEAAPPTKKSRSEGTIASVFASLSGEKAQELPERFAALKRNIIGDEAQKARLVASWADLTQHLAAASAQIGKEKQSAIPQIEYADFVGAPAGSEVAEQVKKRGVVVVKNVVPKGMALQWLEDIKAYIQLNPQVKGFPEDDKQVFELYWSKSQLAARSHPSSMAVQRQLLSLFTAPPSTPVSLETPVTYADRLRIRHPGDSKFALGPHIDGGSVERWEDEEYRKVYGEILKGQWRDFNAWDMAHRVTANQNIYDGPGSCGVFRAFQGWTSLSSTGPGEGTLRVYPLLREMTAYVLLRPLFRARQAASTLSREAYLASNNWELDLETSEFPGSPLGRCQEMTDATHPHLDLDNAMTSLPKVEPGDQAWWHCDMIHAVEAAHNGSNASSVLYIPSVPLTAQNARYVLQDQREAFLAGTPGPDFPGGVGESQFEGRGLESDIKAKDARSAMGLAPFEITSDLAAGERGVRELANELFS